MQQLDWLDNYVPLQSRAPFIECFTVDPEQRLFVCFDRDIFSQGLPPSYVFVATLRLKNPAHRMKFDLWRVLSQDGHRQVAVTVNGLDKSVTFTSTSTIKREQTAVFNDRGIKVCRVFFGIRISWLFSL